MTTAQELPQRGDLMRVEWADITMDPVGNPDTAALARRVQFLMFWESRPSIGGISALIFHNTHDEEIVGNQQGYTIIPSACVISMTPVKRVRRKRVSKARGQAPVVDSQPDRTPQDPD